MKNEPMSNLCLIHAGCADSRRGRWQAENVNTVIKPGDYVKASFPIVRSEGEQAEHLWVQVRRTDGAVIYGVLQNHPVLLLGPKCGDLVSLHRSDIEDHFRQQVL